jgi:hypothetical protein
MMRKRPLAHTAAVTRLNRGGLPSPPSPRRRAPEPSSTRRRLRRIRLVWKKEKIGGDTIPIPADLEKLYPSTKPVIGGDLTENKDPVVAVIRLVDRLGLKIKRGRGPIQSPVIDHIEMPSEN